MTADRAIYLDSSAIVKLAVQEKESTALRRYLRRRAPLVVSALARTEVARALLPLGPAAVQRGHDVLTSLELIRVTDRILLEAGSLLPAEVRPLDAIHLATMRQLGVSLRRLVTYDNRMYVTARALGIAAVAPA
jgi:predicted nucleic acid-binding protein